MVPYLSATGERAAEERIHPLVGGWFFLEEQAILLVPQVRPCTPLLQGEEWRLSLVLSLGRSPKLQIRGFTWQLDICPTRGLCSR